MVVLLDGHVVAVVGAVVPGGAAGEAEAVVLVNRYLLMILMLIWRSITQKPCKKTESSSCLLIAIMSFVAV